MPVKSIFLVDDDFDDQDIFRTALGEVAPSISFATANNGEEALEKLRSKAVQPDLIFLDINMPVLNGFDTLGQIKRLPPFRDLPVYIYSTSVRQEDIDRAKELGALKCIRKPSGFPEICAFLADLLATFKV